MKCPSDVSCCDECPFLWDCVFECEIDEKDEIEIIYDDYEVED